MTADEDRRDAIRVKLQALNPLRDRVTYGVLFDEFAELEGKIRRAGESDEPKGRTQRLDDERTAPRPTPRGRRRG